MCFTIRKNKPIIIFYNDLDKAKQTMLEGLADRKAQYQAQLATDNSDIKKLKRELEEHKKRCDQELEELIAELASVRDE